MRSTTVTIDTTQDTISRTVAIQYPNSTAFMYSRQPVIVDFGERNANLKHVSLTVTHSSGASYTENRAPYKSVAEFDAGRILRLLAPDVDTIPERLGYGTEESISETFTIALSYTNTAGTTVELLTVSDIVGLYGALDQMESYGSTDIKTHRFWYHFPQTFTMWERSGKPAIDNGATYVYPEIATEGLPSYEIDLLRAIDRAGERLESEREMWGFSWRSIVSEGKETAQDWRYVWLLIDYESKPEDGGTYLRWLNRQGGMSYWLFKNSKLRITSASQDAFTRSYSGDPAVLHGSSYVNPAKASYREGREMLIGAVQLSLDDFNYLTDLATSPVIERLITYDGQTSTWQRVTIAGGTLERDIRRNTPNLQDIEFIIELPERNTVTL